MRCPSCGYEWKPRVPNPKECPRCKARMNYVTGPVGAPRLRPEKREVRRIMAGRLPWVAATIVVIVVAAGLAAWALMAPIEVIPPSGLYETWTGATGGFAWGATTESWSGVTAAWSEAYVQANPALAQWVNVG
jgi:hypothetical protein